MIYLNSPFLIEGSEHLIKGHVKRGNVLLLSAVPGAGKTSFGLQFLEEGFKTDQPGMAIVTDFSPDELISTATTFGFTWRKYLESGLLKIIDCYSFMDGAKSTSKYYVDSPSALTNVSIVLTEAQKGVENGRLIVDSASTLLLLSDDAAGVKFLSSISARMKRAGYTCVFILEGGVHDAHISNRLRYLLDGVLDMKIEEVDDERRRFFRIYSLRGCRHETRWIPFSIGDKGFILEE